jgi:hypothetical protein
MAGPRWTWPIVLLLALASSGCVTTSPQALAVASGEEKELAVIAVDARVAGSVAIARNAAAADGAVLNQRINRDVLDHFRATGPAGKAASTKCY